MATPHKPDNSIDDAPPIANTDVTSAALVIVNADDWGRDRHTTDRILECARSAAISSVSAMVFMEDSKRAAQLAAQYGVDAGLHLNLTTPFSGSNAPARLVEHQGKIARFLHSWGFARVLLHPGLTKSFEYVVKAQIEEYERLYGVPVRRVDGHHHQHLCANVLSQNLLPARAIVRRNFSFGPGENSLPNRLYRRWQDRILSRRFRLTGYFFALPPTEGPRLRRIFALAANSDVEVMTHPVNEGEYRFLRDGSFAHVSRSAGVAPGYLLRFASSGPGSNLTVGVQSHVGSAR